jgi:hypothetical protein
MLLVALAFVGGPDALDIAPPAPKTAVSAEKGEDVPDRVVEVAALVHRPLAALLPSSQNHAPSPAKGTPVRVLPPMPASEGLPSGRHLVDPCSPETLQIFRC